jgi:trehalose 6-phosphate phosphatase
MTAPPPLDRNAALFLDIDGTLLEIAPRPEAVQVPPSLPALLEETALARGGALALVSGRPLAQIDALMAPWRGAAAALHGILRRRADLTLVDAADPAAARALDGLRPQLRGFARADRRLLVEDKGATLALHYRAAPEREAELRVLADALQRATGDALRLIAGKMVFEFQPRRADKGRAIAAFLDEPPFRGRIPVFVGDDTTDEDGFAEVAGRGGMAVRVGLPVPSRAAHLLPSVASVLAWLSPG